MSVFDNIKSALAKAGADYRTLVAEREQLIQQREELADAPVPAADEALRWSEYVDRMGAEYGDRLAKSMDSYRVRPNVDPQKASLAVFGARGADSGEVKGVTVEALCFYFPDLLKAKLADAAAGLDDEDVGLPRASRPGAVAKIDQKIADLDRQLETLDAEARAAGVTLR